MRRFVISTSAAASLAFFILALIPSPLMFHQVSITSTTTAFFSLFDGLLRVGWITGSTPIQLIYEIRPTDVGSLPYLDFKPLNSWGPYAGIALGSQEALRVAGLRKHALDWQVPHVTGAYTVHGSQLRTWIGTPAILFAVWPIIAFCYGPLRRFRRRRRGLCVGCGYNLTSNTSGTCPECGTPCKVSAESPDKPV